MKARLIGFGEIELNGVRYSDDVVIDGGVVRKRKKKPSKQYKDRFRHTPLSAAEDIPWGRRRLIIGTGVYGSMPVMPDVYGQAQGHGIEVVAVPLDEALRMLDGMEDSEVFAVLHVTC